MKRLSGLGGGFILLLFLLFPQVSYCAPEAFIQNAAYDAGEVPQGKEISNVFHLKNSGDEPLTFKVRPC